MDIPLTRTRELELDSLGHGDKHRILLELMEDALGRPIELPILVARGRRDGPVFGLTAALHGNEINGLPVIHRIFESIELTQLRGTIVAVCVVNVPGFRLHQREMDNGTDLNMIFPGRAKGNVPQVFAHRFMQRVVSKFDRLLDLHTASFGRVNSLYARVDMDDPVARRMAYLLRPEIILHNRASDRTLRGTATAARIPAVTIEIGDPQRFQPNFIRSTVQGTRRLLQDAKMLPRKKLALGPEPVVCESSKWHYTDRGGLLTVAPALRDRVSKGEIIATLRNPFGDLVCEYKAPRDGIIIGKSVNPVGAAGARIAHIGKIAAEGRFPHRDEPPTT